MFKIKVSLIYEMIKITFSDIQLFVFFFSFLFLFSCFSDIQQVFFIYLPVQNQLSKNAQTDCDYLKGLKLGDSDQKDE